MATPLYCRKCGTSLPPDSQFCPVCGTSLSLLDHTPTNQVAQEVSHAGTGKLPAGSLLRERYRLLHPVGQGGMGAVYVAQDTQLGGRLVAVKEMSLSRLTPQELFQAVEQFKREAHLLASLHHPHLPIIYEYFGEGDRWYLVMSFIEGCTLQAYLDAAPEKKLPIDEVMRIGMELCDVLDYLHMHQPQIIFRDLKPSNIMFTPKGEVYLIDFGIARHFKQNQAKDTAYYFSAGYAPPEQYGQSQTGPQSDIYSLGATLHQMLSGRNPSNNPFQFPSLHLLDAKIPVLLSELITQMLDMNEQKRPGSVAEVKERLARILQSKHIEQSKQNLPQTLNAFFAKRRFLAWLSFMVLSLIIGVRTGSFILAVDADRGYSHAEWLYVAGIGAAVVGLMFLLAKGRFLIDILGGIVLALFGNLVLFTFLSPFVAFCGFTLSQDPDSGNACFPFSLEMPALSSAALILFLSAFLLLLGIYFFLRKGNLVGGWIFGTGLILVGIAVANIVRTAPLYNDSGLSLAIPTIGSLLWLPSVTAGVVVIISTLLRRRWNRPQRLLS